MPDHLSHSKGEDAFGGDPVSLMKSSPFPLGGENGGVHALC